MKRTFRELTDNQARIYTSEAIHPDTRLGVVSLRVADLERSIRFYTEVIGLGLTKHNGEMATLGIDGATLLALQEVPDAHPAPRRATGLFHVAILLPSQ